MFRKVQNYKIDKNTKNLSLLFKAVNAGNLDVVKYYIEEKKVDINIARYIDDTILCVAVAAGHDNITRVAS